MLSGQSERVLVADE